MNMIDMGFGLEIWEKEQERENWKVADWTEEDEQGSTDAPSEKAGDEPLSQGDRFRKKYGRSSGRKTDFLVD